MQEELDSAGAPEFSGCANETRLDNSSLRLRNKRRNTDPCEMGRKYRESKNKSKQSPRRNGRSGGSMNTFPKHAEQELDDRLGSFRFISKVDCTRQISIVRSSSIAILLLAFPPPGQIILIHTLITYSLTILLRLYCVSILATWLVV